MESPPVRFFIFIIPHNNNLSSALYNLLCKFLKRKDNRRVYLRLFLKYEFLLQKEKQRAIAF